MESLKKLVGFSAKITFKNMWKEINSNQRIMNWLQTMWRLWVMSLGEKVDQKNQTLDPTTPWYEWLSYCECCYSLKVSGQPSITRFMKYRNYLKEVGLL